MPPDQVFDPDQALVSLGERIEAQALGPRMHIAERVGQFDRTGSRRPFGLELEAELMGEALGVTVGLIGRDERLRMEEHCRVLGVPAAKDLPSRAALTWGDKRAGRRRPSFGASCGCRARRSRRRPDASSTDCPTSRGPRRSTDDGNETARPHVAEELVEQCVGFGLLESLDTQRKTGRNVQRLPAAYRMGTDDRMCDLRQLPLLFLVKFLRPGTRSRYRDPAVLRLADVMDRAPPLDASLQVRRESLVDQIHVAVFGIAPLARISDRVQDRRLTRRGTPR